MPACAMLRPVNHGGGTARMSRCFLILGSLNAMLAVIFGAFGAHGLRGRLPESMLAVYHTGVQYHVFHALGLFLLGLLAQRLSGSALLRAAGWIMFAGIVLFSGSLYLLALSGQRWLGMVTPLGGLAFILAWLLTAVAVYRDLE